MEHLIKGTRVLEVDATIPEPDLVSPAAALLRKGGLVAFPTETVYGLGANATDPQAIAKIFQAKGRPSDNPLIVHVASLEAVEQIAATISPVARKLMAHFWPGPLTLVLPRTAAVPDTVTGGLNTVGVRMPSHPVALALIREAGVPVAAPSANLSGRPSPTRAEHVVEDLAGRIDMILDGGETGVGLESTVLDVTVEPPILLRPGGVTLEQLTAVVGPIQVDQIAYGTELDEAPRSPGMKYTHYAPNATVVVVQGAVLSMQAKIRDLIDEYLHQGRRVGVLCSVESHGVYQASVILEYGSRDNLAEIAGDLFGSLRAFDRHHVDVILAEGVPPVGLGLAIMNRLSKAAGGLVVQV